VIATAVAAQAEFIVTADQDLLDDNMLRQNLAEYNLRVLWPIEFLALFQ
jgi:predicted nucleic acid-binding protein